MPESDSPASAVLEALSFALFQRDATGALRIVAAPPAWLTQLWPMVAAPGDELPTAEVSPFLDNFLVDAAECWSEGGSRRALSGPWVERDAARAEVNLQATALTAGGHQVLLIERLGETFAATTSVLQMAREMVIAQQRLNAEIQKKEILVHCLAEDLSAALANVITSLRLIEMEKNSPKTAQLLGLALRGTQEQRSLINKVLELFADELGGLYGQPGGARGGADLPAAVSRVIAELLPQFTEKGVRLVGPLATAAGALIDADADHLERILANVIANALENTPDGGEVAIRFAEEPEAVLVRVEDSGERLTAASSARLLSKFESPLEDSQAAFVRLHFCRIAVESCGGEIGWTPHAGGGNCFWIRLPKSRAQS